MTANQKTFELRMPQDLHEQLKLAAVLSHVSMNSYICNAIRDAIEPKTEGNEHGKMGN
jgi:predicted HicB family RNase H-like nuclease